MSYKLGSLFDGSGGFPLSGTLCDIEPMWAAEIEPYPIAVTSSRFPNMKHLGDISKVNGSEIEPVDIITFGSPCQDLSVAGKRAGLKHEDNGDDETTRSGLFMEAVRIIKEMREKTNGKYPRFAVWENVPGAFSSNNGEDFRIVIQELIKIAEPNAVMPDVPQKGWAYADSYCGDGWSLAYRVFDAQYWGVPQRRRRIYLVADFRGQSARKVLFEREGLRGYFETGRTPWKAVAADAERSAGADDCEGELLYTLKIRSGCEGGGKGALVQEDISATLATNNDQYLFQPMVYSISSKQQSLVTTENTANTLGANDYKEPQAVCYGISAYESNAMKSDNPHSGIYEADTSRTLDGNGGNPACNQGGIAVVESLVLDDQGGSQISVRTDGKTPTLRAEMHGNVPIVLESAGFCPEQSAATRGIGYEEENSPTLRAGVTPGVVYSVENHPADSRVDLDESGTVQTLTSRMGTGGGNVPMVMEEVESMLGSGKNVAGCLMASGYEKLGAQEMFSGDYTVIERDVIALDRASFNQGQNAQYEPQYLTDGTNPTIVAKGPSAVCYWDGGQTAGTLTANNANGAQRMPDKENFNCVIQGINGDKAGTLDASYYKGCGMREGKERDVVTVATEHHYIVRRLTPTECARLQGFPDNWGHPDAKTELTDDEYNFWLEVRNTHATINEKPVKDYSRDQMLTWYNKLHTDSAEYKMWGNGIALPCALYVMQGIKEALADEQTARSKWLDDLLRR